MLKLKPLRAVPVIAALLLSGCETASSDSSACPTVVEYTREEQARAADELEALPVDSVLEGMLADYGVLRDQVRACR